MAPSAELEVLNGNTKFSQAMYNSLSTKKKNENVFFSPISAHAVLSMAYQGAAGSTKDAFSKTLHVKSPSQAADGYDVIMKSLTDVPDIILAIANKVYVMQSIPLKKAFEDVVTKKFHSEVQSINFTNNQVAADTINSWVNEKTRGKINQLFTPDSFSSDTRVTLVNAIYFKGNWAHQFQKGATRTEPFFIDNDNKIDCQMMHITRDFLFKNDKSLDAKVLELKYTNSAFSMVVVLPNKKDGIADLEDKLSKTELSTITENMYETEVQVALPKFKIEEEIDLEDILVEMGLGEIFDRMKCNLSEMIDNKEQIYVSKAIQKAFIEVNEEGAEAAAATGLFGLTYASRFSPPKFYANHPFIIILQSISDDESNILFHGRVTSPVSGDSAVGPRAEPDDKEEDGYFFK